VRPRPDRCENGDEKSRVRDSGNFLEIEQHTEAEVVEVGKAMLDSANRIAGRLVRVTAGDFDSVIVKRVAQPEPVARGGGRLARTHYLPHTTPPPTGTGENDLPFWGAEVTQFRSEVQYASWAC
jgi:hypothetical protein